MNQTLLNFVLAVATNELIHNLFEAKSARDKVRRLETYINNKPYKEMKLNINTRAKTYTVASIAFVVFVVPLFGLYTLLDISGDAALKLIILMLLLSYVAMAVFMDKYHVEIERITKLYKK